MPIYNSWTFPLLTGIYEFGSNMLSNISNGSADLEKLAANAQTPEEQALVEMVVNDIATLGDLTMQIVESERVNGMLLIKEHGEELPQLVEGKRINGKLLIKEHGEDLYVKVDEASKTGVSKTFLGQIRALISKLINKLLEVINAFTNMIKEAYNPSANWNGKPQHKEKYKHVMGQVENRGYKSMPDAIAEAQNSQHGKVSVVDNVSAARNSHLGEVMKEVKKADHASLTKLSPKISKEKKLREAFKEQKENEFFKGKHADSFKPALEQLKNRDADVSPGPKKSPK